MKLSIYFCEAKSTRSGSKSVLSDTRKVKVLSLPEAIKEKSTFRAKALRRELEKNYGIFLSSKCQISAMSGKSD